MRKLVLTMTEVFWESWSIRLGRLRILHLIPTLVAFRTARLGQ